MKHPTTTHNAFDHDGGSSWHIIVPLSIPTNTPYINTQTMTLYDSLILPASLLLIFPFTLTCLVVPFFLLYSRPARSKSPQVFGFFHPYCSGGGGGERVLWKMIQILQKQGKQAVIYTIDPPDTDEEQLRKDASQRFDVTIDQPVQLVSLEEYKDSLQPSPYLSPVLESWGTMELAYQGLLKHPNIDVFAIPPDVPLPLPSPDGKYRMPTFWPMCIILRSVPI